MKEILKASLLSSISFTHSPQTDKLTTPPHQQTNSNSFKFRILKQPLSQGTTNSHIKLEFSVLCWGKEENQRTRGKIVESSQGPNKLSHSSRIEPEIPEMRGDITTSNPYCLKSTHHRPIYFQSSPCLYLPSTTNQQLLRMLGYSYTKDSRDQVASNRRQACQVHHKSQPSVRHC